MAAASGECNGSGPLQERLTATTTAHTSERVIRTRRWRVEKRCVLNQICRAVGRVAATSQAPVSDIGEAMAREAGIRPER